MTRPITAGVTVLLYVDMRMRKEGPGPGAADRVGRRASWPASGFAATWRAARAWPATGADLASRPGLAAGRGLARALLPRPRGPRRRGEPALLGTGGTPLTGRQDGQRLARAELSKAIYHPHESLAQRLLTGSADC